MMKYVFLLLWGCLACGSVKAQHQEVFDEFRREAGDQAEMFAGKVEPGYSLAMYTNHPYCFSDEFSTGDVLFKGLLYKDVLLRYDAYLKRLVVNVPVKRSNVYVQMNLVERFTLGGLNYELRNGEFVAVLFSSSRMELIEQVDIVMKEQFIDNKVMYEFERKVKYFVFRDGQMHEVSKLKSIIKLFPDLKKELRNFARMHHLNFKEHRQSSLISMIKYTDELLTKPLN